MSVSAVEQAILDRITEGIHQRFGSVPEGGASQLDAEWIADAMLNAIPTAHPFDGLGPFYDTTGLSRWMGISRQAVHQKVKNHQLLAPVTGDGQRVYPAWQFTPDGKTVPGLSAVLRILLPNTDQWTASIWLTTPSERLGNESAVDHLRRTSTAAPQNEPLTAVLSAAREDATRWAH